MITLESIFDGLEDYDYGGDDNYYDGLACPPFDKEYIDHMSYDGLLDYMGIQDCQEPNPKFLDDQDFMVVTCHESDRFEQCLTCPPLGHCTVIDKDQDAVTEDARKPESTKPKQELIVGPSVVKQKLKPKPKPKDDEDEASLRFKSKSTKQNQEPILSSSVVKTKPKDEEDEASLGFKSMSPKQKQEPILSSSVVKPKLKPKPKPKDEEDETSLGSKSKSTKLKQEPILSSSVVKPKLKPKPKPNDEEDEASFGSKYESTKRKRISESMAVPSVVKPKPKTKDDEDEASFESKLEATRQKLRRAYEQEYKKRTTVRLLDLKDLPKQKNYKIFY